MLGSLIITEIRLKIEIYLHLMEVDMRIHSQSGV